VKAILRMCCPDRGGIVAELSNFIFRNRGNIVHLDQHVDGEADVFFARIEWEMDGFLVPRDRIVGALEDLVRPLEPTMLSVDFDDRKPRVAIFVTKEAHCLYDLLVRVASGELAVEIPLIIGNHDTLRRDVEKFDIPFHHIPVNKENKAAQEQVELDLLAANDVDVVVLARYMQILSGDFLDAFGKPVINIHHSFLPAFIGAKPYHQAFAQGVKLIGATSHYVTADLDRGPIIEQDVIRVTHKDAVEDFIRHGQDLEKVVLARAVWYHVRHRILTYDNKTVVF